MKTSTWLLILGAGAFAAYVYKKRGLPALPLPASGTPLPGSVQTGIMAELPTAPMAPAASSGSFNFSETRG